MNINKYHVSSVALHSPRISSGSAVNLFVLRNRQDGDKRYFTARLYPSISMDVSDPNNVPQTVLVASNNHMLCDEIRWSYRRQFNKRYRKKAKSAFGPDNEVVQDILGPEYELEMEDTTMGMAEVLSGALGVDLVVIKSAFCDTISKETWMQLNYKQTTNDPVINSVRVKLWKSREIT